MSASPFDAFTRTEFSISEIQDWLMDRAADMKRSASSEGRIGRILGEHTADVLESTARMVRTSLQLRAFNAAIGMETRSDETLAAQPEG